MGPAKLVLICALSLLVTINQVSALNGSVELISPPDGTWINLSIDSLDFEFKFTGDNKTANCTLLLNGTENGSVEALNDTADQITVNGFEEGTIDWKIRCVNGTGIESETRKINTDGSPPSYVNIISPQNNYEVGKNATFDVVFSYSDRSPSVACFSLFGGNPAWSKMSLPNSSTITFNLSLENEGQYAWNVTCNDTFGYSNTSETRTVVVLPEPLFLYVTSPKNQTYDHLDDIELNFTAGAAASWRGYSLDGGSNVTVTGNTTFDLDAAGQHVIDVYANDSYGRMTHARVYFSAALPVEKEIDFISPSTDTINRNFLTVNVSTNFDASWCKLSTDGGSNFTMTNLTNTSWYYSLTGLSEGAHNLVVWCNGSGVVLKEEESFRVVVEGFNIYIETPLNKTYWAANSFEILAHTNIDSQSCEFVLNSYGPVSMNKYDSRRWHYNMSGVDEGPYKLVVGCYDSSGFYNSSSVSFTIESDECESNWTGICTGSQYCANSRCVDLNCGECGYAEEHECKAYECCTHDDCLSVQACVSNECKEISCECGVIEDHKCVEYECCSNFDCEINEKCDMKNHTCIKKALTIIMPDSVRAGEEFTILLVDEDMEPVPDAKIKVEYKSGVTESLTTDEMGSVYLVPKESGPIFVTADLAGYDRESVTAEVVPGIDMFALLLLLIIAAGGLTGFFYWKQMPMLMLRKEVRGQEVVLKVKNRSGEYIDNLLIYDTVPRGAFISCGVNPRVEDFGNETHLSWFAALNEGEEIVINYQAVQTSETFSVRVGDDEYQSGFGPVKIMKMVLERLHREKVETPPLE
jgi:hypothetical protein